MSSNPAHPASADPPGTTAPTRVCLLLACFRGARTAARARRTLDRQLTGGDAVLDEVILRVNARHRADPRRVIAGTLTSALTWGVFGLITGGVASGGVWAIIGAVCGGLFAYCTEHLLTKDELKRLGGRLPGDSSAIAAFVAAADARQVLTAAAPCRPATASVAAIGADLSARVVAGTTLPVESSSAPAGVGSRPAPAGPAGPALSMLLLRYRGAGTARGELGRHRPAHPEDGQSVQTELIFESPDRGRLKVSDPRQGAWAFAKSDLVSWGLFGVVYGLIIGLAGNHGAFSAVTDTAAAGVVCAVFGLAAGALYGLWAGRAVSARRLKSVGPLLPPGTSTVLAWSEADLTDQLLDGWSQPGSQRLVVRFNAVGDGALLEV